MLHQQLNLWNYRITSSKPFYVFFFSQAANCQHETNQQSAPASLRLNCNQEGCGQAGKGTPKSRAQRFRRLCAKGSTSPAQRAASFVQGNWLDLVGYPFLTRCWFMLVARSIAEFCLYILVYIIMLNMLYLEEQPPKWPLVTHWKSRHLASTSLFSAVAWPSSTADNTRGLPLEVKNPHALENSYPSIIRVLP